MALVFKSESVIFLYSLVGQDSLLNVCPYNQFLTNVTLGNT